MPLGHRLKRWLFLTHRWIGIGSCLLFAMWFASGLVMIYVPYPELTRAERLAHAEPIDWAKVDALPPAGAAPLSLEMRDGVPVWRVGENTVAAERGATLAPVDAAYAARVASRFDGVKAASVERLERDQWTVAGGFNRHRPLWKVSLADPAGTELYVSSSTGEVVQDTTRSERFWNWLGSVPHWIYPTVLRQDASAWRQVVLWVSGPCIAVALTGIWIGILRTRVRERRFKGGRMTPYHGWMLWHHVAGLVGGILLTTWIFSGWLSVDPGNLFASPDPDQAAMRAYAAPNALPPLDLARLGAAGAGAQLATFTDDAGQPRVTLSYADGARRTLDAASLMPAQADRQAIVAAAQRLVADGKLTDERLLTAPDAYWYEAGKRPQLPVLRLQFADPARTWLYLDPATGELLQGIDARGRIYRWLYQMLHTWDLNALTLHRPLWDVLLWAFSLVGLVTSVSGVWLGVRRLRRKATHARVVTRRT